MNTIIKYYCSCRDLIVLTKEKVAIKRILGRDNRHRRRIRKEK